MYDAALSRFHTLDPLAEDYSFQSPYVYAANNPIRFIDWMGMGPGDILKLNSVASQLNGQINKMTDVAIANDHERSAMITTYHFVSKNLKTGNYDSQKMYALENERTDNSKDRVSFDTDVENIVQGKVHVHTDNLMPPSPGDVLNLSLDTDKEGFFSIVTTSDQNFALVIEDSDKAKEFLDKNSYSITTQANNLMNYFMEEMNMPEDLAQKEAIYTILKNSGIGFYETVGEEKKEYKEVESSEQIFQ